MARRGRPVAELTLTDEERETLQRWARRAKSSQALAQPSRIVLGCAAGKSLFAASKVSSPRVLSEAAGGRNSTGNKRIWVPIAGQDSPDNSGVRRGRQHAGRCPESQGFCAR